MTPICEVLGSVTANSAFHGTRLDVEHISGVMEQLVEQAEAPRRSRREDIAGETVFVSHETYTPARGGSAAAEIHALRDVFGDAADRIVIANTKGFTGHPMGVGIEDVVAVKALETGIVPPVPNFREPDPELGQLNLSKGGAYPVRYALRLAAGFGSQICMLLLRWTPVADGRRRNAEELGYAYRIADRAAWTAWLRRHQRLRRAAARGRRSTGCASSTRVRPAGSAAGAAGGSRMPAPAAIEPRGRWRPTRPPAASEPAAAPRAAAPTSSSGSWRSSPRRPATRPRCSPWTSTSRPTSASTRSSRPRSSPRSARPTGSRATTRCKLRDYPTLAHVVALRPRARPAPPAAGAARAAPRRAAGRPPRRRAEPPPRRARRRRRPSASSRSSPRRPATRPRCSTWTSTSRPTSGSTRSSRPRSSPRSARPTGSSATTR